MFRELDSPTAKLLLTGYLTVAEPARVVDLAARIRMRYFEDVVESDPWAEAAPEDVRQLLSRKLRPG